MESSSTRRKTALAFLSAFEHLDVEAHISLRSSTCSHLFAPASYSTRPPLSNFDFAAHLSALKSVIKSFAVVPKEVMEDQQQNRVIIWATGQPTFVKGVMDGGLSEEEWVYIGEYMFILSMDESGEKIERIVEFLDNKAAVQGRELVARARGTLKENEGVGDK
jgi:hypothetical protein